MQQDNHQQRTFTSWINKICDCGELHNELWELSDIDRPFAQVLLPDDVIDVRGNVEFASKVT